MKPSPLSVHNKIIKSLLKGHLCLIGKWQFFITLDFNKSQQFTFLF